MNPADIATQHDLPHHKRTSENFVSFTGSDFLWNNIFLEDSSEECVDSSEVIEEAQILNCNVEINVIINPIKKFSDWNKTCSIEMYSLIFANKISKRVLPKEENLCCVTVNAVVSPDNYFLHSRFFSLHHTTSSIHNINTSTISLYSIHENLLKNFTS